jgi:flagellar basal-body rod protein FlgC
MSDFLSALNVAASGLSAERTRVDAAASNLANAESTRGPDGQPYHRREVVLGAQGGEFQQALGAAEAVPVEVRQVIADPSPGKRVYSPGHPDADADGFVTLPDVNPVHETVNLMSAQRGYEANATAIETLKSMASRALDI